VLQGPGKSTSARQVIAIYVKRTCSPKTTVAVCLALGATVRNDRGAMLLERIGGKRGERRPGARSETDDRTSETR
jgi:hypothetical protein